MESMKANFEHWSMIIPTPRQNRELGPLGERRGGASGENEKIQLKTQKKCSRYE